MEEKVIKKYLFITQSDLSSDDSNGRTLREVFSYIQDENIYCFCTVRRNVNISASRSFCIEESRLFRKKSFHIDAKPNFSKNIIGNSKVKKNPLTCFIRNIFWNISFLFWKRKYKKWIKAINPDFIVFNPGDFLFMHKLVVYTSKVINKKMVIYNTEDYIFKTWNYLHKENGFGFLYPLFRKRMVKIYKNTFSVTFLAMHNTEGLTSAYKAFFPNVIHKTVFHPSSIKGFEKTYKNVFPLRFYYCGALDKGRGDIMVKFSKILRETIPSSEIIINGLAKTDFIDKLGDLQNIKYEGFVSYDEVVNKINETVILLSINSMDEYNAKDKYHGFSTKISDYVASLNIIFHIGPSGDETNTIKKYGLGYVSETIEEIRNNLLVLKRDIDNNGKNKNIKNQMCFYQKFLDIYFVAKQVKKMVEEC